MLLFVPPVGDLKHTDLLSELITPYSLENSVRDTYTFEITIGMIKLK
jgi:hypothetical protein